MDSQINTIKGRLFVLYGASGSGKSTLLNALLKDLCPHTISQVITYTCRLPREHEIHGRDYHFVTPQDFQEKLKNGFFIETNEFLNNLYGCPISIIDDLKKGKNLIVILDRNGALKLSQLIPNTTLFWISAPYDLLANRMRMRNDSEEQIITRLKKAELEHQQELSDKLSHHCIINDDFDAAFKALCDIIATLVS